MDKATFDVVCIGNAIVDVLASVDDTFLAQNGLDKGIMTLIDEEQAEATYAKMGPAHEISGGSAANTVAGLVSLGGKGAFIGRVRDDQLGQIFRHDIRAGGVAFETAAAASGKSTARCFVLVTPDAQRTMLTYLGACTELTKDDIDPSLIAQAKVTYMEGYLWDPPQAKAAIADAAQIAHDNGRKVALTLSDPFCVERHRDTFLELISNSIDILFANEAEIMSLFQTETFDEAAQRVAAFTEVAALTRSELGSVIVADGHRLAVPAEPVPRVVDTTGAGDLYAAGFLYGYTHGRDWATCARLGGLCAAEIISHMGARPEASLADLVRQTAL
jgi:sugar/nucleoside kinase (ribokinase family)